jgi:hypothetical protein
MKYASKEYLTRSIKIHTILEEEIRDKLNDFNEILDSIEMMKGDIQELEHHFNRDTGYDDLSRKAKEYENIIETMDNYRKFLKLDIDTFNTLLNEGKYNEEELSVEDLMELHTKTHYCITLIIDSMNTLKPVQDLMQKYKKEANIYRNNPSNDPTLNDIMNDVYRHYEEAKEKITHATKKVVDAIKDGNLQKIVEIDSKLAASIKLKKEETKR